jgi:hypothetical protein
MRPDAPAVAAGGTNMGASSRARSGAALLLAAAADLYCAAVTAQPGVDAFGNRCFDAGFPPAVIIRSPSRDAVVAGEIAIYAEAAYDCGSLAGVQFMLDGGALETEDTTPPYSIGWDTATVGDGRHTLAALARFADGRWSYAEPLTVTVANEAATVVH